ncbi:MAG: S8 family serine peptidase [Mariniphaga sp.]|nr:S8 family serine peptidase [Mariniphaga sp.]
MFKTVKIVFIFLMLFSTSVEAQTYYWIGFTDKANFQYTILNPTEYLSERAIERRQNQGIPIDEFDLPVNDNYINEVLNLGATYIHSSKWLNGITVKADSADFEEKASLLSFVNDIQVTKRNLITTKSLKSKWEFNSSDNDLVIDSTYYGASVYQVGQLNGQYLHNKNFRGQGKHIAVLDGGYYKTNEYTAFDSLWANGQILGTKDFVNPDSDIFQESYHGMSVLSTMGGNIPGLLIGTAPKASFWLIRSEDTPTEFLIEEDNWVAAAEYADSVGADIINSSLGYYLFDDTTTNHNYADMDGNTTRVTQAANIAASKGMVVVASAGNEGNDQWKYILAPSDGDDVIAVAAVDRLGDPAYFTSYGPASDGGIKPNVAAIGQNTVLQKSNGLISTGNGTSFSGPVIAGMAACLWQANPEANAQQIKEAIEKSAHLYNSPDSLLGYGIPDFMVADQILKLSRINSLYINNGWTVFPNPFSNKVVLFQDGEIIFGEIEIEVIDISGRVLTNRIVESNSIMVLNGLSDLPSGIIFLKIKSEEGLQGIKLIKID